jgi:hypothetical protein
MKPMTEDQLRRHALASGAELTIDGRPFNTERAQVAVPRAAARPPPIPVPAAPPPPAAPNFTQADVERMLAEQEARFTQQLSAMLQAITSLKENASEGLVPEGFTPKYDSDGAITFVGVTYARIQ